ncbi:sodium-coupled neutral amino acid transporter 5-like isoform X1 [Oncorhynchus keta]|uniref:sodium-coupled neutral amino acid transporter 5-like isoform X1 n=1 Tax=Oncorhynchus keta TaxID=8018 RepID=UPI0015FCEEF8|nr:sodium-coupled neutral amino acid transporter 5-like isoform X1 [Oncorhynchus keta]XP_035594639.1 sodium-coupled neutral amino acid transporter 5-like isoform X1 [Oncorhynchus keta]
MDVGRGLELQKMNGQHSRDLGPDKLNLEDGFDGLEFMAERDEFLPGKSPGIKAPQFTDFEGKTSFGMSIFNLSNAIMGSGILGLAYAMSNTGIVLFLILLLCIAILSAYSIHLLLRSAGVVGIRAYEQLGHRAFGQPGKVLAGSIITMHNIGGTVCYVTAKPWLAYVIICKPRECASTSVVENASVIALCVNALLFPVAMSSYMFIVKSELPLVMQAFLGLKDNTGEWYLDGKYLIIIVSVIIVFPLSLMRHLGYLGYTSGFSLSCMVFFLISVIYKKFNIPCPLEKITSQDNHLVSVLGESHDNHSFVSSDMDFCEAQSFTINMKTAYTIPILAFAFVCHPEVLPIYTELRDATKKRMQTVANISILAMFVMYGLTAIFGYLTFFGGVDSELLHTYIKVDPLDTLILCVRMAVLVAVTLTVPVVLFPIRRALLQLLFPEKPFHWAHHISIAVCLLVIVNLLVIFVPTIRDIFGVIGATSAPSLIFILPGIFYIRIVPEETEPLKSIPKIMAACFAALGFVFMVMSTSFIILDWVSGESRSGGGH